MLIGVCLCAKFPDRFFDIEPHQICQFSILLATIKFHVPKQTFFDDIKLIFMIEKPRWGDMKSRRLG